MRLYNFDEVVGNSNVVAIIRQSLANDSFPQIAIFSGVYGTGKSTCAEIVSLALTCKNSKSGLPCLECENCKSTIKALQTTAENTRVIKINVAHKNTKEDLDKMIRDIFVLKSSSSRVVYIIEEAHSLSKAQQTAFLEELDKIQKGVYVIFCTTKITDLLPELRSRAINFAFTRINDNEAAILLSNLERKYSFYLDNASKQIIINYAKGIPRQLTNLYEFVKNGGYQSETLASFLGVINENEYITLFEIMSSRDMFMYTNSLDQLLKSYSIDVFLEQMKEFMLKVVFLIEGSIKSGFSNDDIQRIRRVFNGIDVLKVANVISNINYNATEADFKFSMLKIRQIMCNKTMNDIVKDSATEAVAQVRQAKTLDKAITDTKREESNKNSFSPLNLQFLNQFGGD